MVWRTMNETSILFGNLVPIYVHGCDMPLIHGSWLIILSIFTHGSVDGRSKNVVQNMDLPKAFLQHSITLLRKSSVLSE